MHIAYPTDYPISTGLGSASPNQDPLAYVDPNIDPEFDPWATPQVSTAPTLATTTANMPTLNPIPPTPSIVQPPTLETARPAINTLSANAADWSRGLTLLPNLQSSLGMNNLMFSVAGGLTAVLLTSLLLSGSKRRR